MTAAVIGLPLYNATLRVVTRRMLKYLLKNTDFGSLLEFVSPNFTSVLAPVELMRVAQILRQNSKDRDAWNALLKSSAQELGLDQLEDCSSVLTLFFQQIFARQEWILDFRPKTWSKAPSGRWVWSPDAIYYRFTPKFCRGVRDLYSGFYLDDAPRFDKALKQLGLLPARDVLRKHFGEGDQTRVEFKLKSFQNTFTSVFKVCAKEKFRIPVEFAVLGFCLLTLYATLEESGLSFNVRAAFEDALARVDGA